MSGGSIGATTKSTTKGGEDGLKVRVSDREPWAGSGIPLAGRRENVRGHGTCEQRGKKKRRDDVAGTTGIQEGWDRRSTSEIHGIEEARLLIDARHRIGQSGVLTEGPGTDVTEKSGGRRGGVETSRSKIRVGTDRG